MPYQIKPVVALINDRPVTFHASPLGYGDFPWVGVVALSKALGSRLTETVVIELCQSYPEEGGVNTATHDSQIIVIVCHALAQGIAAAIDHADGNPSDNHAPKFDLYCRAAAKVAIDSFPMSLEELMLAARRNTKGPSK